ncbi:tumor susceptibility gene 101 protein [Salarias fasciatus]|uniref:tumor susceptibility gene 101 protein n=1 Tax=Salarias fasciatus TaxID=181472 RepID=UPI0011768738|nr:tumor susceptibility gene 101 protein-like [Salarias fasciatus]
MLLSEDMIKKMLPRAYLRRHVAHEIFLAIAYFKDLVPTMEEYIYNDGTSKNLMSLKGTIPVMITGKTYNIPISLWIEDNYPQTAPICYVRPTREMMVLRGKFVSSNGEILLPYLEDWSNESELLSLLQIMAATFGENPPLVMRPRHELEQGSCALQFQRQGDVLTTMDESSYLSINREDGQPFQQQNETNC